MMIQLTSDGLGTVGEIKLAYEGWEYPKGWVVEIMALEAPKLIHHNGYYYLVSAQGGTAGPSTAHMAVVARSNSVEGPWENSPYNPMVRTQSRDEKWWRQGHGTLIDDVDGNWWFLYTGYENGYTALGKQSLLLPVEWTVDDWPRVPPGVLATDVLPKPAGENVGHGMPLSDDFSSPTLGIQWMYEPDVDPNSSFRLGDGKLSMKAGGESPTKAISLSVMPVNHVYEVEVEVSVADDAEGGLLLSSGRFFHRAAGAWASAGLSREDTFCETPRMADHVEWDGARVHVRIRNNQHDVSCFYSADGVRWIPFKTSTEVNDVRMVSLYAAGEGEVVFRNFKYRGLE
jgi:xylan 1,4-beta-xylosidase